MSTHKALSTAFIAAFLALAGPVSAQNADNDAIKKTVKAETDAWLHRDAEAWAASWMHEATCTRTMVDKNSYSSTTGWSNFGPGMVEALKKGKPISAELKTDNYIIRANGNIASVEYDQYMSLPNGDPKDRRFSREYRVLVQENGEWKIASQITHDPETYDPAAQNIERDLNQIGYKLIHDKKIKEAIEVFRANVTTNPNSSNCYDSLGEAYALDGDIPHAIENYEKAIAMDPKRESSKKALAKLKQ